MTYVIIGNGIAGISAAESIRQFDPDGDIMMIGDENNPPYCRPMISLLLEGVIPLEKIFLRPETYYEKLKIHAVFGHRVQDINPVSKIITTQGGHIISYHKLLIASGADPRPIRAEGLHLQNLFFMRRVAHVQEMVDRVPDVQSALVLGGGLVGFKAAYALLRKGVHVSMLIRSDYPLSMQVDDIAGKMILEELVSRGLHVKVAVEVTEFEGRETVEQARLSDGTTMPCDMVVIGKGVLPAVSFVPRDQIKVDLGVRVDEHMRTSASDVFAAGDVAEAMDMARGIPWVNAIWPEAVIQGRAAGMNMVGRSVVYRGSLGRNVIRIFDLDIMSGGIVTPPRDSFWEVFQHVDMRSKTYRKLVFQGNNLCGFVMVNHIEQGGILASLIQNRIPVTVSREKMLEPSFNFRQIAKFR